MFFQGIPWRLVLPPPAGAQMPPALLGCRQARLRLSAGQRGRSGVSEPTGAASPPSPVDLFQPPKGPPLCQLPQRPCGREAGGGSRVGVPAAGGRGEAGQEGTNRRQRLGYIAGFQGQVTWAVLTTATHSHTVRRTLSLPDLCGQREPLRPAKPCPWPGLSSGGSSSSPKSSPSAGRRRGGERGGTGGTAGGREEGKMLKS